MALSDIYITQPPNIPRDYLDLFLRDYLQRQQERRAIERRLGDIYGQVYTPDIAQRMVGQALAGAYSPELEAFPQKVGALGMLEQLQRMGLVSPAEQRQIISEIQAPLTPREVSLPLPPFAKQTEEQQRKGFPTFEKTAPQTIPVVGGLALNLPQIRKWPGSPTLESIYPRLLKALQLKEEAEQALTARRKALAKGQDIYSKVIDQTIKINNDITMLEDLSQQPGLLKKKRAIMINEKPARIYKRPVTWYEVEEDLLSLRDKRGNPIFTQEQIDSMEDSRKQALWEKYVIAGIITPD